MKQRAPEAKDLTYLEMKAGSIMIFGSPYKPLWPLYKPHA